MAVSTERRADPTERWRDVPGNQGLGCSQRGEGSVAPRSADKEPIRFKQNLHTEPALRISFSKMAVAEPLVGVAVLLPEGAAVYPACRFTGTMSAKLHAGCLARPRYCNSKCGSTLNAHERLCYCHHTEQAEARCLLRSRYLNRSGFKTTGPFALVRTFSVRQAWLSEAERETGKERR
jgi:hypothetical protein